MKMFLVLFLIVFSVNVPDSFSADFYVFEATYKSQSEALSFAAEEGGWVLNTNFYSDLKPNLYAVVRGPFRTKSEASGKFSEWKLKDYLSPDSYYKNAGEINPSLKFITSKVSPQMLAMILGEMIIEPHEYDGSDSQGCSPFVPHIEIYA